MVGVENLGPDGAINKLDVIRLNRAIRLALWLITILLPLFYTYLSFKDIPFTEVAKSLSSAPASTIIWKLTLAIYFFLWVVGTRTDASDQELVYRKVPNRGQLSFGSIGVILGICILGAILLWSPSFEFFIAALGLFFLFNIFAWQFLVRTVVKPSLDTSIAESTRREDFIGSEQLHTIRRYLCGSWQWWRFAAGGIVIASLGVLTILKNYKNLNFDSELLSWELLQALGMLLFVCVMEIWVWTERLRTKISLEIFGVFRDRYTLRLNEASSPIR